MICQRGLNRNHHRIQRLVIGACFCILLHSVLQGCASPKASQPEDQRYLFQQTNSLVDLVNDGAKALNKKGLLALQDFDNPHSRWRDNNRYLFVYDLDGVNLFHPIFPEFEGKNMSDLRDISGRRIIEEIKASVTNQRSKQGGWVFYQWRDGNQLTPTWKSSYVKAASLPDGREVIVGSGLHLLSVEPAFVEKTLNSADAFIKRHGLKQAMEAMRDDSSTLRNLDLDVFILTTEGTALLDPVFLNMHHRDLRQLKDVTGFAMINELLSKLKNSNHALVQFLWPRPGEATPSRKRIAARRVEVDGQSLIIAVAFFAPTPIWMQAN